jgi:hypothetical protein
MNADALRTVITDSLLPLALAREAVASGYVDDVPRIVMGVTHCESCGFHYSTPRDVVTWRDRCQTPERHPVARTDAEAGAR